MALTISYPVAGLPGPIVPGTTRWARVKVKLDNSYNNTGTFATSGYALTGSLFGMSEVLWANVAATKVGRDLMYDADTNFLHVFVSSTGLEVANAVDLSADYAFVEIIGH